MLGIISNIQRFAVHDGPGIRTTVFMQGCPLQCWWCHNPESISLNNPLQSEFLRLSPTQLLKEIKKDVLFMEESGGGISFSGGEPLLQSIFLAEVLELCKAEGMHTCIDTSGMAKKEAVEMVMDYTDLFLYDIKFVDMETHTRFTGVSNRSILKNLDLLLENKKELIIRFPLIPGINDQESDLNDLKNLMLSKKLTSLDILPYHRIAEGKYERLNMKNKMKGVEPHPPEKIEAIKEYFTNAGLEVSIGG